MRQYRYALGLVALVVGLLLGGACGGKPSQKAAAAPPKGVVGKVLSVKGKVTYSHGPRGERKPLTPGMELRAEWTVHTARGAGITARLNNGHLWALAGDLSKRISRIRALTLKPVKEGAVTQLSDLGSSKGKDRSAAAGLHQERTAGTKAAPNRTPTPEPGGDLDEVAPPMSPKAPPPRKASTSTQNRPRKKRTRSNRRRTRRQPPKRGAPLDGLVRGGAPRGGGASLRSRAQGRGATPTPTPRPALHAKPSRAKGERESLPKRLTPAQVHQAIRPRRSALLSCLKKHKITTALRIRLVVRGATGKIAAMRVPGRSSSDAVVRCLRGGINRVRFPRFSTPSVTYTVRLKTP